MPPAGVTTDSAALLGLGSIRAALTGAPAQAELLGQFGRALGDADTWAVGDLRVAFRQRLRGSALRLELNGFGLAYSSPFVYRSVGAGVAPAVELGIGRTRIELRGDGSLGSWVSRVSGEPRSVRGELGVAGAALRASRPLGRSWLTAGAGAWDVVNGATAGTFASTHLGIATTLGPLDVHGEVRLQRSPLDDEVGWQLNAAVPLGAARLALHAGRTVTDMRWGARGAFAAGFQLEWRAASLDLDPPPIRIEGPANGGRRVRFRIEPDDARTAAIVGDFTDWRPVPMRRERGGWAIELPLGPGLHHFAFLLDGERWYVPPDAPGLVDDGWGRRNASIVVQP